MNNRISPPLACRYCHHYQIEGRRGGFCHQLGVPVKGEWHSCSLMTPSFSQCPPAKAPEIKLRKYVSEIYSYETAAQLKSSTARVHAKAS